MLARWTFFSTLVRSTMVPRPAAHAHAPPHTRANIMSPNTIGDIAYAVGYGAQWDEFHDQVSAISTRLPYMTCIGNHERDFPNSGSRFNGTDSGGTCPTLCAVRVFCVARCACRVVCRVCRVSKTCASSTTGECGVAYEVRYPMPTPARDQPWYSFDYGSVHFVFMSSEHNFTIGATSTPAFFSGTVPSRSRLTGRVRVSCVVLCAFACACAPITGGTQWQWIEADLRKVDRTTTPWIIFSGHRPMYIDSN